MPAPPGSQVPLSRASRSPVDTAQLRALADGWLGRGGVGPATGAHSWDSRHTQRGRLSRLADGLTHSRHIWNVGSGRVARLRATHAMRTSRPCRPNPANALHGLVTLAATRLCGGRDGEGPVRAPRWRSCPGRECTRVNSTHL